MIKNFVIESDKEIKVTLLSTRFGYFYKHIENKSKKVSAFKDEIDGKEVVVSAGQSMLFVNKFNI
jgi:hypothetical protein